MPKVPKVVVRLRRVNFNNKIFICVSEASETQYWLEVIVEAKMLPLEQVKSEHEECGELLAIFTSISTKL